MHVLMAAIGSAGDIYPLLALGEALQARGHVVSFMTNDYHEQAVRRAGLPFVSLGTRAELEEMLRHPHVWHPLRSWWLIGKRGLVEPLRPVYERIAERNTPGKTLVVASSLALGARVAHDKLGVPLVTVHGSASMIRSSIDPPDYPGGFDRRRLPAWINRALFGLIDWIVADPVVAPGLNAFRKELGLAPVHRFLHRWCHSPQLVLGTFPDWFYPSQPDWPPNVCLVGFTLYDGGTGDSLSEPVRAYLDAGPPPVVFMPGSANWHAAAFFAASADACRRSGRRGLFLTSQRDQIPVDLPQGVRHFDYVPFRKLLPHCAALVHAAGIGTCALGMEAALPQLVMPLAYDQPDNAGRLERLGVALSVKPRAYTGPTAARLLDDLLARPEIAKRCKEVSRWFDGVDAREAACQAIEDLAHRLRVSA